MTSLRNIFLTTLALIFFVGPVKPQASAGFILDGRIEGLKDKTVITLILGRDTVGQAISKEGRFVLRGEVNGGADYYFLYIDTTFQKLAKKYSTALWLENKKQRVIGSTDSWPELQLEGSSTQIEYLDYLEGVRALATNTEKEKFRKDFISSHPNSLFTPYLIVLANGPMAVKPLEDAYRKLTDHAKMSFHGEKLRKEIEYRRRNAFAFKDGVIGAVLPNFKIQMIDGKIENIRAIAEKNKYVLVDFWASWCVPCRKALPGLKKMYEKYNEAGFEIVGVSIDKNHTAWKKAVSEDGTTWIHGIDGIDNASKEILALAAIPGYVLIDKDRRIIDADYSSILRNPNRTEKRYILDALDDILKERLNLTDKMK